jgi:hypothetical protein
MTIASACARPPKTGPFFQSNLSTSGRWVRGGTSLALAAAAVSCRHRPMLALGLGMGSGFVAFEALRGWCLLRACGIKTKL